MALALLTALAMTAFAANSLLNRLALLDGDIGPTEFAAIRVAAGVTVLFVILIVQAKGFPKPAWPRPTAVLGLAAYMLGFSFAYVSMDAGLGALVLFGVVQVTMFVGALLEGERPPLQRWGGMALALIGLGVLTMPGSPVAVAPTAVLLMIGAAIGWGVYSLAGRSVKAPVPATAWSFAFCLPIVLAALLAWPDAASPAPKGVILAIASGGITSALGYALWYALLPKLGATKGALAQLSVPAIAMALGALLLGEAITHTALLACLMILGGIAVGMLPKTR